MRLFTAIPIPDEIRDRLARLQGGVPGARWISPENFHITLHFIGDVTPSDLPDIISGLARVPQHDLTLALKDIGSFGDKKKPRSIHALVATNPALNDLAQSVARALDQTGHGGDPRKFVPHVTLARLKGADPQKVGEVISSWGVIDLGPWTADHFILYRSHLGHTGSHYEPLMGFGAGGAFEIYDDDEPDSALGED